MDSLIILGLIKENKEVEFKSNLNVLQAQNQLLGYLKVHTTLRAKDHTGKLMKEFEKALKFVAKDDQNIEISNFTYHFEEDTLKGDLYKIMPESLRIHRYVYYSFDSEGKTYYGKYLIPEQKWNKIPDNQIPPNFYITLNDVLAEKRLNYRYVHLGDAINPKEYIHLFKVNKSQAEFLDKNQFKKYKLSRRATYFDLAWYVLDIHAWYFSEYSYSKIDSTLNYLDSIGLMTHITEGN